MSWSDKTVAGAAGSREDVAHDKFLEAPDMTD